MSKILLSELMTEVIDAVKRANYKVNEIYQDRYNLKVEFKSDDSPLTVADLASNKILVDSLRQLTPDIPIISEENKQVDYSIRKNWEWFWLIDPLDGTKEFLKGNGQFTVNVALIHKNRPVLGVVGVPTRDTIYYADVETNKAWRLRLNLNLEQSSLEQIKICPMDPMDLDLCILQSNSHSNDATQGVIARIVKSVQDVRECKIQNTVVRAGSSLKFMKIAEGNGHYYPRITPCMEWDTAASDVILSVAGGIIYPCDDKGNKMGAELLYNKPDLLNPYFIAGSMGTIESWESRCNV